MRKMTTITVLAIALAAFVGCSDDNDSGGPNANPIEATVTVGGVVRQGVLVKACSSTALLPSPRIGCGDDTYSTATTNSEGVASLTNIPPSGVVCISATIGSAGIAA